MVQPAKPTLEPDDDIEYGGDGDGDGDGDREYRFEVDMKMLPEYAKPADLKPFCEALQRVMDADGTNASLIVACFVAQNPRNPSGHHLAWGWPDQAHWNAAVREVFGIVPFPTKAQRLCRRGRT